MKFLLKWRGPICCHGEERRNMSRIVCDIAMGAAIGYCSSRVMDQAT